MIQPIILKQLIEDVKDNYFQTLVTELNDHCVRISAMEKAFDWHFHPNSDETFIGIEGVLIIETVEESFEISPGMVLTMPANTIHRTLPKNERSVNLVIEKKNIITNFTKS